jgi:glycolate oxidase
MTIATDAYTNERFSGLELKRAPFQRVTKTITESLRAISGGAHVFTDEETRRSLAFDAATRHDAPSLPDVVIRPGNADEITKILEVANRELVPVTPRGGGTGLTGAAVPVMGGILLDLVRLNQIQYIDVRARYAVVEPGVRTADLQQAAQAKGLLYAGDPCSNDACVVGGNIATNAGGNRAVKYGVTSDQVLELEIVTPLGKRTTLGGRLKKNSTGYNLLRLFCGSEGTLGIVTRATLRLRRLAPLWPDFQVVLPSLSVCLGLVEELREDPVLDPTTLEVLDYHTVLAMERYSGQALFGAPEGDVLLVQCEATGEDAVAFKWARLKEIARRRGCLSVHPVVDSKAVWDARRGWGKALEKDSPVAAGEDLVLPVEDLVTFVDKLESLVVRYHFEFRLAGHAGDGNMHLRIIPGTVALANWPDRLAQFRKDLYRITYDLGGRLSGEHGIGLKRKQAFQDIVDPVELSLMKAVKHAFDPNGILNPGKIFDSI